MTKKQLKELTNGEVKEMTGKGLIIYLRNSIIDGTDYGSTISRIANKKIAGNTD